MKYLLVLAFFLTPSIALASEADIAALKRGEINALEYDLAALKFSQDADERTAYEAFQAWYQEENRSWLVEIGQIDPETGGKTGALGDWGRYPAYLWNIQAAIGMIEATESPSEYRTLKALDEQLLEAVAQEEASQLERFSHPDHSPLASEIVAMRARDQSLRLQFGWVQDLDVKAAHKSALLGVLGARVGVVDMANTARMKKVVADHGWLKISDVGVDVAGNAWLLIQHADRDREFQRYVLSLMEPLVSEGEASGSNFAYLYDRVNRPQRYGTQYSCVDGVAKPFELEDPDKVEEFRAEAGLESFEEYMGIGNQMCGGS